MKKFALLLVATTASSLFGFGGDITRGTKNFALAEENTGVYSIGFDITGGKDVMPIGVWWGPSLNYYDVENGNVIEVHAERKYFDYLKEGGFNVITVAPDYYDNELNQEKLMEVLDICLEYQIGYTMLHEACKMAKSAERWISVTKDYINHPACIGVHLIDEPAQTQFASIASLYRAWEETKIEDKYLFTNLLATGCTGTMYSGTSEPITVEEYYRSYLDIVKPKYISSDIYPFRMPDHGTYTQFNLFKDMSLLRALSLEYEIPYWCFVQAGGQFNDSGSEVDSTKPYYPNEGEMLWNVNVQLAYGCKSISYFTFFQPDGYPYTPGGGRDFHRNGLLGVAGNRNQWYYYAQKANKQIAAIDHILMNASTMGVIPIGNYANRLVQDAEKLTSFRELQSCDGEDFIIGCFDYFGKTALYVVNNSSTKKQQATLRFNSKYKYHVIQRAKEAQTSGNNVTLTLEAGEGIMVVVE